MDSVEESLNRIESAADISAALDNLDLVSREKTKLYVFSKNNKALKAQVKHDNIVKYNKRSFSIQGEVIANSDKIKDLQSNLMIYSR